MIYPLLRDLLFRLDPEAAHELTTEQMIRLQQLPLVMRLLRMMARTPAGVARRLWGLEFASPVGIAAGFDKNATMLGFLAALGFGFLEVGTVTLHPQPGNPRPRMFRYPAHKALINRLGFNNEGADRVAERLQRWAQRDEVPRIPLFVNVGKNRDVPLDRADDAYAQCFLRVGRWADGAVLNLSSPNTPSLRDLQRPEHLEKLLTLVRSMRDQMPFARPGQHPVLVKIAPDLEYSQVDEICEVALRLADGLICTNTTVDRPFPSEEAGGLSGAPLLEKSTGILRRVRQRVGPDYPLIGVGGVMGVEDARTKLAAGASLVQIYTGFVYEGPMMPSRMARALA